MPLISVMVPVYNAKATLDLCVDSILKQTFQDFELLLMDDESTDGSGQLCDAMEQKDSRIHAFHKKNDGVGLARNALLEQAKGEYFCFVDSDDYVSPYYLEILLQMCRSTSSRMAVASYEIRRDGDACPVWKNDAQTVEVITAQTYYERLYTIHEALYVVPWGKLYHRSVYDGVRYPAFHRCDDEAVIHQLVKNAEQIAISDAPIYAYYMSKGSVMRQSGFKPALLNGDDAYQMREEFFKELALPTLQYLNQRTRAASLLEIYSLITPETDDAVQWRKEVKCRFDKNLWHMVKNPAASKHCVIHLLQCRGKMKPGTVFSRTELLFGDKSL